MAVEVKESMAKWKVKSGGLTYGNKRYVKGNIVDLPPGLGERFINKLELVEPDPVEQAPVSLLAVSRGHGDFDVLNMMTGVKINDSPLSAKEADDLVNRGVVTKKEEKKDVETVEPPKDVVKKDGPPPRRRAKPKAD